MAEGRWRIEDFRAPGCGLANGLKQHLLQPNQFTELSNLVLRNGVLMKRGGTVQQGDAPDAAVVRWIYNAYDTVGGSVINRLRFCNGKIQYLTGGAWTNLATGLTATTYPNAVSYKDAVYWVDGTNTPRVITIGSPPTIANWTTLPSGINPRWVVLHQNRLYYGGDITTPTYVYMTAPGDPTTTGTTDFYQVPDNQRGFYPAAAVNVGDGIGLFAQDYLCYLTGTGPLSHRIYQLPKGAAALYPRTVVDMGGFAIFMTERGPFIWDGHTVAEPLDPYGDINWGDINFTTNTDTHAVRYGDYYILFYRSKGNVTTAATGTAFTRFSTIAAAATRLSTVASASAPSQTSNYIIYDTRLKQWGGGTGNISCAHWEEALYGDTQDLWVGDSTTGGKVGKWDQAGTYTDYTVPYETRLRTAPAGDAFRRCSIDRILLMSQVQQTNTGKCQIAVWSNGSVKEPPTWRESVDLTPMGTQGGVPNRYGEEDQQEDVIVRQAVSPYKGTGKAGFQPQIEITEASDQPFVIRGIEADFTTEED